jgi:hypothetical protein
MTFFYYLADYVEKSTKKSRFREKKEKQGRKMKMYKP